MRTLHFVSHTHWDREWYLPFQRFRLKLVRLMDGLLNLLATDPDYRCFMLDGQTIVLDDYLDMRPEREEEIRGHVQAGRLLIGPWHILPDEFLVGPEATIRNLLQGERTARRFGAKMMVGYIPDPFGHIGQMPQILRGFGIDTAVLRRGLADEPCELRWQAPDGSSVFLAYMRDGYDNAAGLPLAGRDNFEAFVAGLRRLRDSLSPHTATEQILLMCGTDHMEPPPLTSAALAYAQGRLEGDSLVHSSLPAYLEAVQSDLRASGAAIPTVSGELRNPKRHHLLPGVLSTRMWIKQRNQACETLLEKWAEPFSTWAALLGDLPSVPAILRRAWRLLMECHPHDSICGCSVDQVHQEMRPRFDQVEQIGEEITRQSLEALAAAVDTRAPAGGASAVVVFNPTAGPRRDVVTVRLEDVARAAALEVVDESGRALPCQVLREEEQEVDYRILDRGGLQALLSSVVGGAVAGQAILDLDIRRERDTLRIEALLGREQPPDMAALSRKGLQVMAALADPRLKRFIVRAYSRTAHLEFVAGDIPGYGYRTFWVRRGPLPSPKGGEEEGRGEGRGQSEAQIQNDFLTVTVDPVSGTLTVTDRRSGASFSGLNRFVDGGDCGDEYNYCPPAENEEIVAMPTAIRLGCTGSGQSLEILYEMSVPVGLSEDRRARSTQRTTMRLRTVATLRLGVPRLDLATEVDNPAGDHRLRVHFPFPFAVDAADYDGHFQVVRRPLGVPPFDATWVEQPRPEVPQRAFTDVSDGRSGLMLASRGLPEVEVRRTDAGGEIALTLLRCVGWLSRADFPTRRGHAGPALPTPGAQEIGRHRFEYAIIPHAGGWEQAYQEAYAFNAPLRAVSTGLHAGALPGTGAFLEVEPAGFVQSAVKAAEDGEGIIVRGYNITDEPLQVTLKPFHRFARACRTRLDEREESELAIAPDGSVTLAVRGHEVVTVQLV